MHNQKLLFIGSGPLLSETGIVNQTAFGLRTWQFLSVIESFNGDVRVILLDEPRFYTDFPAENTVRNVTVFGKEIEVIHLQKNVAGFEKKLKKWATSFHPTVLVGINLMPSFFASRLRLDIPFWADLNGWGLAEAQSQAFVEKNNAYIPTIWQREKTVLQTADCFSVVSDAQRLALFGQISTLGRLRFETETHKFAVEIPNANETRTLEKYGVSRTKFDVRKNLPAKAKIVFFSGAYNTWLDEKNLFLGLEMAMKNDPNLYFVSTGSGIKGFSNKVFASFKTRIEQSEFSHRFVFLGWLDRSELIDCYAQVDMAINVDRDNTETLFGARNRINEWLVYGVPVLSTVGSDITKTLAANNLITPLVLNSAEDIAQKVSHFEVDEAQIMAQKAMDFAKKTYSYERTMHPFRQFLKHPIIAPDKNNSLPMKSSLLQRLRFKYNQIGLKGLLKVIYKKLF